MRINKSNEKLTSLTESFLKNDKPLATINLDSAKKYFKILSEGACTISNDSINTKLNQTINKDKIINKNLILNKLFPKSIFTAPKYHKCHIRLCKKIPSSLNTEKESSIEKMEFNDEKTKKNEINEKPKQKARISEFKKILLKSDKKLTNNKSIIYKKKPVMKNKTNVVGHKRNLSMNYYIIPKFNENKSTIDLNDSKIEIKVRPNIRKIKKECMLLTKIIINNKKEELSKIIYIQKIWKKIMMEKQFKPIIYDYKEFVTYLPNSFYYNPKKPYQDIINNISNNSNISNNLNSIMSYTNNKEEDNLGEYYNKYNKIKITSGNITLNKVSKGKNIDLNIFPNNQNRVSIKNRLYNSLKYKAMNNINNTFSYNYSNTYNNNIYNYKSPNPSSLKINKSINSSNIKSKSKIKSKKYSIANIIIVKNNLNKWVKNRIKFDYTPHEIDKYKKLRPNKNFIAIISHKKEKRLFLNNENKETIPKPKIKKNKGKSKITHKININEGNLKKIKSMVNKNKINKVNRKQKLMNQFFIDDIGNNEPPLNIENKLIMKKPIFHKKEN